MQLDFKNKLFHQKFNNRIVVFRLMWESAVITAFDGFSLMFNILWISRAVFSKIKRAIAKKTVEIFHAFMTRVIFTLCICKKFRTIFHNESPFRIVSSIIAFCNQIKTQNICLLFDTSYVTIAVRNESMFGRAVCLTVKLQINNHRF